MSNAEGSQNGYTAAHVRVKAAFGLAESHQCVDCQKPAQDWSYSHDDPNEVRFGPRQYVYSNLIECYKPRCKSCHRRFDDAVKASKRVPTEKLLTVQEVADVLGTSASSVRRYTEAGLLKMRRTLGGHRRYRVAEVEDFQTNHPIRQCEAVCTARDGRRCSVMTVSMTDGFPDCGGHRRFTRADVSALAGKVTS